MMPGVTLITSCQNAGRRLHHHARALLVLLALLLAPVGLPADAVAGPGAAPPASAQPGGNAASGDSSNGTALLEAFDRQQTQRVNAASALTDQNKHFIMFSLSIPLFVLLLITGGLGIATGVYGKKLFIPHMIFAGLTVTVALAHAIAGIVWFFPF